MSGNICRCGAYSNIVDAITEVAGGEGMKPFTYERARTPAEAAAAVARTPGAKFIAGGTNLLDLMKLQIETPRHLIDVNGLGLDKIEPTAEGGLRIGALVRNTDLAADERVRRDYGVLSRALLAGASGQLRNKATTAGNLLQRTRCPYFYDTDAALQQAPARQRLRAIGGVSRQLAVIGSSEACIATHPSDMAVAMRVLDATVETVRPDGHARASRSPISTACRATRRTSRPTLEPGELITARDPAARRWAARTSTARCATARPMPSPWSRSRRSCSRTAAAASRSAASPTSRGGSRRPTASCRAAPRRSPATLLAGAEPTTDNAFKLPLVERTLAAVLTKAKG